METELNNKVNKTLIEFNYFLQFRYKSTAIREEQRETAVFTGKDNMWQCLTSVLSVELSRTGMHYQAKLLGPHIDSKHSYLNILVNDEFLILRNDWCCGIFMHFIFCRKFFNVITFNFFLFYSVRRLVWWQPCCKTTSFYRGLAEGWHRS